MSRVRIKSLDGALCGMMPFSLCNCRLRKKNWTARLWDCVLVLLQERRKKNREI